MCVCVALVKRLDGVRRRGESGGGAAGAPGEAELRADPDEGEDVVSGVSRVRGGAGAGDGAERPHQERRDEHQIPERHQRGDSVYRAVRSVFITVAFVYVSVMSVCTSP